MKLAFLNGSPKAKKSVSEGILESLKKLFPDDYIIINQYLDVDIDEIPRCNAIVLAFPLYVDGIPAQLLSCLYRMETYFKSNPNPDIKVYVLVNCGFYEGKQNSIALEMVENWCAKAGITWGQGIGIGGGGMLTYLASMKEGQRLNKNLDEALKSLAENISTNRSYDNIFITPNIPRFLYKVGGDASWRKKIKANGLTTQDLFNTK